MKGNSSKKKLIVAATLVGVVLLAAVISVVAVLAAATQTVNSSITVTYSVTDVSAKVSAKYKQGTSGTATDFTAGAGVTVIEFDADDANTSPKSFDAVTVPALTSTEPFVTFEYKFENKATKAFNIYLTGIPTGTDNMSVKVLAQATAAADMGTLDFTSAEDAASSSETSLATVTGSIGAVQYIYIRVSVINLNESATLGEGGFQWLLDASRAS